MSTEDRTSEGFSLDYMDERDLEVDTLAPSREMSVQEKLDRINALNEAAKPRGRRRVNSHLREVVADVNDPLNAFDHQTIASAVSGTRAILLDFAETFQGDPEAENLIEEIAKRRSA